MKKPKRDTRTALQKLECEFEDSVRDLFNSQMDLEPEIKIAAIECVLKVGPKMLKHLKKA